MNLELVEVKVTESQIVFVVKAWLFENKKINFYGVATTKEWASPHVALIKAQERAAAGFVLIKDIAKPTDMESALHTLAQVYERLSDEQKPALNGRSQDKPGVEPSQSEKPKETLPAKPLAKSVDKVVNNLAEESRKNEIRQFAKDMGPGGIGWVHKMIREKFRKEHLEEMGGKDLSYLYNMVKKAYNNPDNKKRE